MLERFKDPKFMKRKSGKLFKNFEKISKKFYGNLVNFENGLKRVKKSGKILGTFWEN